MLQSIEQQAGSCLAFFYTLFSTTIYFWPDFIRH